MLVKSYVKMKIQAHIFINFDVIIRYHCLLNEEILHTLIVGVKFRMNYRKKKGRVPYSFSFYLCEISRKERKDKCVSLQPLTV